MRMLLTTLAFVGLCAALCYQAARPRDDAEQREAVYARNGETAADARARIEADEACTSSEFGHCHPFPR